jgi:hypothetical protein
MTDDLGYVNLDPNTLKGAEASAEADRASCVVRGAVVVGRRRSAAEVEFWRVFEAKRRPVLAFTRGERT